MSLDRATADRLSEHLDAVVNGDAARADGLDLAIAATVEHFFAADDVPGPPPGLAEYLWQELSTRAAMEKAVPLVPAALTERNGRAAAPPRQIAPPRRGSSALAFFATAALIALTLIGSLVVSRGPLRLLGPDQQEVIIPATDNVPERVLLPGGIADVTLLQTKLENLPAAAQAGHLALNRYHLAPGATQPLGSQADSGVGLDAFTVEAGRVTVEADAPVTVTRTGADQMGAPSLVEPGATIVLDVGDQLYAPNGVSFRRRNDGSTTATTLDFSIGAVGDGGNATSLPQGVTVAPGFPDTRADAVPAAPTEAIVQRLTLPPGAELAVRDVPGLELVYVEAGALDVIYDDTRDLTGPTGSVTIGAENGTDAFGRTPERAVLANRGAEPLVILTASLVPTGDDEASPPAWSDGWGSGDRLEE